MFDLYSSPSIVRMGGTTSTWKTSTGKTEELREKHSDREITCGDQRWVDGSWFVSNDGSWHRMYLTLG